MVSDLDGYDEAANSLQLQVLGAVNHQKRAFWRADPANWSTVTLVATNNPDNRSKLRMDDCSADTRSASNLSDPSDNISTIYDGQQWMLTPVLSDDDDYHPPRLQVVGLATVRCAALRTASAGPNASLRASSVSSMCAWPREVGGKTRRVLWHSSGTVLLESA